MITQRWLNLTGLVLTVAVLAWAGPIRAAELDSDNDGLTDEAETTIYHTDPQGPDTDGDGFNDGDEVGQGLSPLHGDKRKLVGVDSDKDYLSDAWEIALGTDLTNPDTDGDKYLDGTEVIAGYDPLTPELNKLDKLIIVDLKKQHLTYLMGGKKLEDFPISSGIKRLPTPTGDFKVLHKMPIVHYKGLGYDYPNTKWNLHFTTGASRFYIHGAYWHNDFGKPKSHGCVNVSYQNMERLYNWAQVGTPIKITG